MTKISALATITAANLTAGNMVPLVDVNDTSMGPAGTDKSITLTELLRYIVPPGTEAMFGGPAKATPVGWLYEDGRAVSRATYPNLFGALCMVLGTATITNASPAVVTRAAHLLQNGDGLYFTTTGTLPAGLSPNTLYHAANVTANTFQVSSSITAGVAEGGTVTLSVGASINTSSAGSGVHTVVACPWGNGDGSTTFNLPDRRGSTAIGNGSMGGSAVAWWPSGITPTLGQGLGEWQHTLTQNEMPNHAHGPYPGTGSIIMGNPASNAGLTFASAGYPAASVGGAGSSWSHNTVGPVAISAFIIKT